MHMTISTRVKALAGAVAVAVAAGTFLAAPAAQADIGPTSCSGAVCEAISSVYSVSATIHVWANVTFYGHFELITPQGYQNSGTGTWSRGGTGVYFGAERYQTYKAIAWEYLNGKYYNIGTVTVS